MMCAHFHMKYIHILIFFFLALFFLFLVYTLYSIAAHRRIDIRYQQTVFSNSAFAAKTHTCNVITDCTKI